MKRGRFHGSGTSGSKALRLCGLGLDGAHHRALDDAKNIARLLPWIVGGQRLPT